MFKTRWAASQIQRGNNVLVDGQRIQSGIGRAGMCPRFKVDLTKIIVLVVCAGCPRVIAFGDLWRASQLQVLCALICHWVHVAAPAR